MQPRFLIVQHQSDAPPGVLGDWAGEAGLLTQIVRPDLDEPLPAPSSVDVVALLGSDESAIPSEQPWIDREARWVGDLTSAGTPVLGICFGAQLLAVVLGGARRRATAPQVAWIEVRSDDEESVPPGPWFAWHADVIDAPPGAHVVARNRVGVQAFALGPHLGVQFHPEVTPEIVDGWAGHNRRELARLRLARRSLHHQSVDRAEASAAAARCLFDGFLSRAAAFSPRVRIPSAVHSSPSASSG
jgi:GMP synthase (glutamine-hydrolysing)